jgi:hypothetical protein
MRIWLPDDKTDITVDTGMLDEDRVTVYQQRITLTLQQIKPERGFESPKKGEE